MSLTMILRENISWFVQKIFLGMAMRVLLRHGCAVLCKNGESVAYEASQAVQSLLVISSGVRFSPHALLR